MTPFSAHNPAFTQSVIEYIVGVPFAGSDTVQLLESGSNTFQTIVESLTSARNVICMEFYIFKDDATGKKIADLLKEKARDGVQVYLLYDHFGSFLTSRRFWSDLKKAGIHVRVSHPFRWFSPLSYLYRNHKKLLVIDGTKAVTGGFNIADEYHGYFRKRKKVWRDTGIYLEGPIASVLHDIFRKAWTRWKGESIEWDAAGQGESRGVPVIPVFANSGRARRRMRKLLLYSIKNARESILLTTAYFNPSKKILNALVRAAQKGIRIRLLFPDKSDVLPVLYAGRSYYARLLKAGAEIYNYQGVVLHAKTFVFDEQWSIVGSANLDLQSLRRNEESNVGILDRDFSMRMKDLFEKDLLNSSHIDAHTWHSRPFYQKFLEKFFAVVMGKL